MGLNAELRDRIDALAAAAVEAGQAPGLVIGVAIGDDEHVAIAGTHAADGGPPMTRDTLFRISSVTKPITGAAVARLAEEGLIEFDEPVDRLLPELANRRVLRDPQGPIDDTVPAERAITIHDLLAFTWGFGQQGAQFDGSHWPIVDATNERDLATIGPPSPGTPPDPDTWIARLGELPLMAQPGDRWLYHSGSQVLGVLAARAAGAPFDEVLRSRVFEPLGMGDTSFSTTEPARLPTSYFSDSAGAPEVNDPPEGEWASEPAFFDGGAGLLSTVDDMLRFGRMLRRGGENVMSPESVANMTRNHLTDAQRSRAWPGWNILGESGWGYGVGVDDDGSYGWAGGLGTRWLNVPDGDATVVTLSQRGFDGSGYAGDDLVELIRSL
ncbi:MAG: serine hydrolase domain-containing protein [Pseudoclavibacter sp.]